MFSVYLADPEHLAISYFKYFTRARTLTGSPAACLTWISKVALNPLILKPFLDMILTPLLRVRVDSNILKLMVSEISQSQGNFKKTIKHANTTLQFSARIPPEDDLPEYFEDLERDLSKF
ncbi:MAG: hypothetical protein ACXAC7_20355 [Candidatus Hodarchaeales archaeon]|jgi:hypothetical protein